MPASEAQIVHLLSRTGARVNPAQVAQFAAMELPEIVARVTDFSVNPAFSLPDKGSFINANGDFEDWRWGQELRHQWMDRLATMPSPLQAKLALFWNGLLVAASSKVQYIYMGDYYRKVYELGAGSFEALMQSIALDEAMLYYLDNFTNRKNSPQENFARELMELFTLGVNKGYDQNDVREVARAWTGYGIRWDATLGRGFYEFQSYNHDAGNKTIFGITKAWTGPQVITELCAGVRKQQTAEHLAGKLWSFFAYEQPQASLVQSLAADYLSVGLNTLEFLKKMFVRPEFYSAQAMQGRVKTPMEWCAMVLGATGLKASEVGMIGRAADAGHEFLSPPNVAGWKLNNFWLNESVFWVLDGVAKDLSWWVLRNTNFTPPTRAWFNELPSLPIPDAINRVLEAFGLISVSAQTRRSLESWLTDVRAQKIYDEAGTLLRLVAMSTEARMA